MNLVKTIIDLIANTSSLAQTMGDALRVRGFKPGGTAGQVPVKTGSGDFAWTWQDVGGGGGGGGTWGSITGTLSEQTDLQTALNAKAALSHTHGNISNTGTIGSTADQVLVTTTGGTITTATRSGIDSRTAFPSNTANISDATNNAIDNNGSVLKSGPGGDLILAELYVNDLDVEGTADFADTAFSFDTNSRTSLAAALALRPHELAPLAIVTEAANFTLSQSNHGGRWTRLTKSGSTQNITLPTDTSIAAGTPFHFFRATAESLAFSGGTVNGEARLADVVQNSAFGLVYLGSGTYDFI
jgi:hypothetical protein